MHFGEDRKQSTGWSSVPPIIPPVSNRSQITPTILLNSKIYAIDSYNNELALGKQRNQHNSSVLMPFSWSPNPDDNQDLAYSYDTKEEVISDETNKSFFLQTIFPFLLAGCGMVAAGVLLDKASQWQFLSEVPEAMILVPALLGLKGNLEMTLASRLSTIANLGLMDQKRQQFDVWTSNVSLIQAQAITVSLIAATIAVVSGGQYNLSSIACLMLTSALTASVASFLLASLMVGIAILARKCNINPDNIATPLAGATGDFTTLFFLILFGTYFYQHKETWLLFNLILLSALVFSIRGNLVAVQSSKISTYLHQFGKLGVLPANRLITYLNPFRTFALKEKESEHSLILLLMAIPGSHSVVSVSVVVQSHLAAEMQSRQQCHSLLTAMGDLLGSILLAAAFLLNSRLGGEDVADEGDLVIYGSNSTMATLLHNNPILMLD
uniref:SLC41A/MgtE integral membrane domain-containing protein n=1 Tax=Ditylenchus dipsaci TaxID=166011 RepID=A0A915E547_9BILA